MTDYKQCIIIRDDLKLSKGKLAVQVAHAAVSSMEWASKDDIEKWKKGGQKKVVLRVKTLRDMFEMKEIARKNNLPTALIKDAGLTQIEPGTITVLGIGPAEVDRLDRITGDLKLV
ncbi:peptidyl-tRNA hydrolase Pth2 [Methanosalsum natronophilum]|uniref:Peptidyl-tRNA hydrolase n=1 Tax=Methanosalsum natronophilum TaxID=768733 RepID=A0A424YLG8_9EURY|nr:peptidyl-tRNA hydrolase Pth2 [Methanosalsum natronophilum]MCS3923185.1 PTH2 family peptidyl-tRNA hydrolase [Methanosalsum natronophilum]RQD79806.1 MAG: peptidyl-tRNA hydrolase [Methanosalsum natronophilum]